VKPASTPQRQLLKQTWTDFVRTDMFVSAASVLVVAQAGLEFPEGLMNYPVYSEAAAKSNIVTVSQDSE
jgi:hypothetical protein